MKPQRQESCETCRHFDESEDNDGGICRRRSPQVAVILVQTQNVFQAKMGMQHQVVANFPPVGKSCWCSEFDAATGFKLTTQ